mgnify:CR=1 FL=1|jgi:hypothetical protein
MAHPKNKMSAESKALVSTLNSDDRKKPKVKATPKKVPESADSKQARAGAAAVLKTLNSDDRTKHAKQRTFK